VEGDDIAAPAGWYPDPLGLPQLRWWDSQAWTEFTSEAQAPVMVQPAPAHVDAMAGAGIAQAPADATAPGADAATAAPEPTILDATAAASVAAAAAAMAAALSAPPPDAATVSAEPAPAGAETPAAPAAPDGVRFMSRRERREYERRHGLDTGALGAQPTAPVDALAAPVVDAAPRAYIPQPVMPEPPPDRPGSPTPRLDVAEPPHAAEPPIPEPLLPEPLPERPAAQDVGASTPHATFADLVREPLPAVEADGDDERPPAAPSLAQGPRELESGLAGILADAVIARPEPAAPSDAFLVDAAELEDAPAPARTILGKRTYTVSSWLVAISLGIQAALAWATVYVLGEGHNLPVIGVIWIGGLVLAVGVAAYDRLLLKSNGHAKPASAAWALLTPLAYLIARYRATKRETGRGAGLFLGWGASAAATAAAVFAFPGLAISAFPAAFTLDAEASVASAARALGAELEVACPANAVPLDEAQTFTCVGSKASDGTEDSILVGLERRNGWVSWIVQDWGAWVLTD